jgi:hypothetical protein
MIPRPPGMGAFHFVVLATLRSAQLMRGCRPRVDGDHKAAVLAQCEVAQGKVMPISSAPEAMDDGGPALLDPVPIVMQYT